MPPSFLTVLCWTAVRYLIPLSLLSADHLHFWCFHVLSYNIYSKQSLLCHVYEIWTIWTWCMMFLILIIIWKLDIQVKVLTFTSVKSHSPGISGSVTVCQGQRTRVSMMWDSPCRNMRLIIVNCYNLHNRN